MNSEPTFPNAAAIAGAGSPIPTLLTEKETARYLKLSTSWLAKARMNGNGPPYMETGRSIRYAPTALLQWMKSRQRRSTSDRQRTQRIEDRAPNQPSKNPAPGNKRPSEYISIHQDE